MRNRRSTNTDELTDARAAGQLKTVMKKLVDYVRMFGG